MLTQFVISFMQQATELHEVHHDVIQPAKDRIGTVDLSSFLTHHSLYHFSASRNFRHKVVRLMPRISAA
ncbi:Uncharacterised protein [Candidatus Venteria ishoeyi]|uniref:Uncharacterized protein n=1 Tax=Candidatus Venteria ishoeyi TaxID=1899563 RepID=A0A1H6FIE9_9GAMM|nr:Uncharacterised protein [Candidatus Venteria ishoeyi]SEH09326.1 Uncharacterised protein [Candidatus Venteria ishoeyi]